MVWAGDGRGTGTNVPASVRRGVRIRDNDECQLRYDGCTGVYEELDHKDGVAQRGIDRRMTLTVDELQCACRPCHKKKTARQAAQGRSRKRYRDPEPHPGRNR